MLARINRVDPTGDSSLRRISIEFDALNELGAPRRSMRQAAKSCNSK